jgi:hypothetical protein
LSILSAAAAGAGIVKNAGEYQQNNNDNNNYPDPVIAEEKSSPIAIRHVYFSFRSILLTCVFLSLTHIVSLMSRLQTHYPRKEAGTGL